MTSITAEKLIAMVRHAFRSVQRGAGTTLHETQVIDNYGSAEQRARARTLDTDQHWWEVPDGDLEQHDFALVYLDRQGLHYYLPALMTYALRHGQNGWGLADRVVYTLANPQRKEDFSSFDERQSRVVARYIQFVAEHAHDEFGDAHSAARAIKRYWHQFL